MVKTILWISRHPILPKQKQELRRIFGECEVWQFKNKVRDIAHIFELIQKSKADEVVTVLPLSIIMQLVERGIKPLYAVMKSTNPEDADYIDEGTGRAYKFTKFVRIVKFEMVTEDL